MKELIVKATIIAAVLFCLSSCSKEDEPETLEGEIDHKIAQLNDAGAFLSFNLKLMDGESPVPGASVVLSAGQGDSLVSYSEITDDQGVAYFEAVKIGGNIMTISKDGYFTLLGIVDFRFEEGYNFDLSDNQVVVIPRSESAIVPFYPSSAEGNAVATVSGAVTIEADLTNTEPEVPTGTTIKANFSKEVISASSGVMISEYTISSDSKIGSGTIDEDGNYEINVPVALGGSEISLIIPEIQANQTLAVNGANGEELIAPEIRQVLTSFGPDVYAEVIPFVSGVTATFSDPAPEGDGFNITNFQKAGRPLFAPLSGYYYYTEIYPGSGAVNTYGMTYEFNAGQQYQSTPTLEVQDPTGSGFASTLNMSFAANGIKMTNTGLYNPETYVSGNIRVKYKGSSYSDYFTDFYLYTDEAGKITQDAIDEMVSGRINSGYYRWGNNLRTVYDEVDSFYVEFSTSYATSGVTATGSVEMNGQINYLTIYNRGGNYTDPTFTFSGGDPSVSASIEILEFATPWTFELDNSNITPYVLIPNIDFEYLEAGTGDYEINSGQVFDTLTKNTYAIEDLLTADSEGTLVYSSSGLYPVTNFYSLAPPEAFVFDQEHTPAQASVRVNAKGGIDYLYSQLSGKGYTERPDITISPSIEGLPGSGADIVLRGGDYFRGEYRWGGGHYIKNSGEGYIAQANQVLLYLDAAMQNFSISGSTSFTLTPGDVVYRNITYGTGRRTIEVY